MSQRERNNQNTNNSAYDDVKIQGEGGGEQRSQSTHFRVLRCFCGCSALTFEQIEHFSMMNTSTLICHPIGKRLFANFLRIGHQHDKSEAMLHLECFDLCDNFLTNTRMIRDKEMIDDLLGLCPSYLWEERITNAINEKNSIDIYQVLKELKHECVQNIECHNDYDRFRRELLRKIGKS